MTSEETPGDVDLQLRHSQSRGHQYCYSELHCDNQSDILASALPTPVGAEYFLQPGAGRSIGWGHTQAAEKVLDLL